DRCAAAWRGTASLTNRGVTAGCRRHRGDPSLDESRGRGAPSSGSPDGPARTVGVEVCVVGQAGRSLGSAMVALTGARLAAVAAQFLASVVAARLLDPA